jgi:hypothetical protein
MSENSTPRTTKYGSSSRETAFDAFRKVAVGVLGITTLLTLSFTPELIRLVTGPTVNSGDNALSRPRPGDQDFLLGPLSLGSNHGSRGA